jgi:exonuclease III
MMHQRSPSRPRDLLVYSHNVNGISPYLQTRITGFFSSKECDAGVCGGEPSSLRGFLRRHGWPTLLFLQEVKISPDDRATITGLEKAVSADRESGEPHYVVRTCLPSDKHNARGFGRKVYGVASIIREDFFDDCVDSVRTVEWDREGRIQIVETKAFGPMPKLGIINVYAVNGTDLPYKHSETGAVIGNRHDRKLLVHAHLASECRTLETNGYGVIIAGDLNVARSAMDGFPKLRTFPPQHCVNRADFEAKFFARGTTNELAVPADTPAQDELVVRGESSVGSEAGVTSTSAEAGSEAGLNMVGWRRSICRPHSRRSRLDTSFRLLPPPLLRLDQH